METNELKPCPFCGGEAYIILNKWVFCSKCGAESDHFDSKDKAIEAWNRRFRKEDEKI